MQLVEQIKQIALNAVESTKPVNIFTGEVTALSPLTVKVNPKMVLSKQLIVTHTINKLINDNELSIGNRVLLARVQGGQKFVVMDKL